MNKESSRKRVHGGNLQAVSLAYGIPKEEILDFSANINPLGPPEWLRPRINRVLEEVVHYPDPDCSALRRGLAAAFSAGRESAGPVSLGVSDFSRRILPGNGSEELMFALARAARKRGIEKAVIPVPCYGDYREASLQGDLEVHPVFLKEEEGFRLEGRLEEIADQLTGGALVFIGRPNNPTGLLPKREALLQLIESHADSLFCVDEAFIDFCPGETSLGNLFLEKTPPLTNLLVLRSSTKFFALPGIRLGFALGTEELLAEMVRYIPEWSVNLFAQEVGKDLYLDADYHEKSRMICREFREELASGLAKKVPGGEVYPGTANYLFLKLPPASPSSGEVTDLMARRGIAIRDCASYEGLDDRFLRVAVRGREETQTLLQALGEAVFPGSAGEKQAPLPGRKKPGTPGGKTIMFQGTSSNAGKSILAAAMCRVLREDGYRVAPFKAQNMALNSFVTRDGGEMGRAQVVQAAACGIDPDVRMNPVLLKPSSDTGSQVILNGKPLGNMQAREYYRYKERLIPHVKKAFTELSLEYDVIVLEGAGSPGEVNLREQDIVNMKMASMVNAPVLLVGDIDRGGVFASLVGTMDVLREWERQLVAGFILNKFRGDPSLLSPASDYVERYTGRKVLGVVPHIEDLQIPEEDSVSFKESLLRPYDSSFQENMLTIGLIDLPHISNFTDFDALKAEKDVRLVVITRPEQTQDLDALIIPGSKNVASDLEFLKQRGIAREIRRLGESGACEVAGICGGYQMLGEEILDPSGIETKNTRTRGLSLLRISTELKGDKILSQVTGIHKDSGEKVVGYEIHHGETKCLSSENGEDDTLVPVLVTEAGEPLGLSRKDLPVWGTYLHGVFDAPGFRRVFLNRLRRGKGLAPLSAETVGETNYLEAAFTRLAGIFRKSVDLKELYRVMGLP